VHDDDIEKVESIIMQKKARLKNSKDVNESDGLFAELDGLEWLERQIAVYILQEKLRRSSAKFIAAVYAARSESSLEQARLGEILALCLYVESL
jgi:hypothetical protein